MLKPGPPQHKRRNVLLLLLLLLLLLWASVACKERISDSRSCAGKSARPRVCPGSSQYLRWCCLKAGELRGGKAEHLQGRLHLL